MIGTSQKGVTDRQTDGQTENTIRRAAWSQLKRLWISLHNESAITYINPNTETKPYAAIMTAIRKRVI